MGVADWIPNTREERSSRAPLEPEWAGIGLLFGPLGQGEQGALDRDQQPRPPLHLFRAESRGGISGTPLAGALGCTLPWTLRGDASCLVNLKTP